MKMKTNRLTAGILIVMLAAAMALTAVGCQKASGTDSGKFPEKAISAEQFSVSPANKDGRTANIKFNLPGYEATVSSEWSTVELCVTGRAASSGKIVTATDDAELTLDTSNVEAGEFRGLGRDAVAVNVVFNQEDRVAGYALAVFWAMDDGVTLDNAIVLKAVLFGEVRGSYPEVTENDVEKLIDDTYFKYVKKLGVSCMTDDEAAKLLQYEAEHKGADITADPKVFEGCKNLRDFELDESVVFLKDYDIYVTAAIDDEDVPQYVLDVVKNVLKDHNYSDPYGYPGNQEFVDSIIAATKAHYGIND